MGVSATLLIVVFVVLALEKARPFAKLYHYLPSPFWCYFIPMLLATAGMLPERSPVYDFITTYVLAGCLILLLLNIDLPGIARLGPTALGAVAVGTAGIAAGAFVSYALFAGSLPPESWKGIGALSASWTGGSANMVAVKEGLNTPDAVFAPLVIVDTVVTYTWMGVVIALAVFQDRWDRWVGADRTRLDAVLRSLEGTAAAAPESLPGSRWVIRIGLVLAALFLGAACLRAGTGFFRLIPATSSILSPSAWAFLIATAVGILLSFTPAAKLERWGASQCGYFLLYLLLAAIGSKARLQHILAAPLFIAVGSVLVLIHASLLIAYGYFRRVPMFFLAAASQANIGGTASTPIVAGIYQPRLASVGLLLAIAVNVIGTYIGYLIAYGCHYIHP